MDEVCSIKKINISLKGEAIEEFILSNISFYKPEIRYYLCLMHPTLFYIKS